MDAPDPVAPLVAMYRTGTPQERQDAASNLYVIIRRTARRVVPVPARRKAMQGRF